MITLTIGDTNLQDMGIVLEEFDIGIPEPKRMKVTIPGRNGDLDMSHTLTGEVAYQNRSIQVVLGLTGSEEEREQKRALLFNLTSGKTQIIRFSHLQGYFIGTIIYQSYTRTPAHATIKAVIDCEPFRYLELVEQQIQLSSDYREVILFNLGMSTPLSITTTHNASITANQTTYNVQKGTHQLGILAKTGSTLLRVKGEGTLTTSFRMAVL